MRAGGGHGCLAVCSVSGAVAVLAVAALAQTGSTSVRVRAGDTLSGLAARHGISVADMAAANGIADPNRIGAGDVLAIPAGAKAATPISSSASTYLVRQGDSLSSISARHGVTLDRLAAANGIVNRDRIRAGTTLSLPLGLPPVLLADPARLALAPRFDHWAGVYGVPADLLKAICWMESGWQNHVVSSVGAMGIGQLTPAAVVHAQRLLGTNLDPLRPDDNIRMSARYVRWLLDTTGGDELLSAAAYMQGLRAVQERGIDAETAQYVTVVVALRPRF